MTLSEAAARAAAIAHVRRYPGQRCEEIAARSSNLPSLVSVALRKLRDTGKVKSKGNTRGTRWRAA
jgi:hypothetical protein